MKIELNSELKKKFRKILFEWSDSHPRPLPWKGEKDPYLIWLSEIILQQTRVEQGWSYYERFRAKYPDIHALANAPEDEVMKLWQGLGYYSRARNLHLTAKNISQNLGGKFPANFTELKKLKGVGEYTAAAISSFAFNLPQAVVDGNVFRVLARIYGIDVPIDSTQGKKLFSSVATELLDKKNPAKFNQAMMDFGAMQCTPGIPDCQSCPFAIDCLALHQGRIDMLPLKSKKLTRKTRYFHYLVCLDQKSVYIRKRTSKDIWRNLYEFPLVETQSESGDLSGFINSQEAKTFSAIANSLGNKKPVVLSQVLTHQNIIASFWKVELKGNKPGFLESSIKVNKENLQDFAFPKVIDFYINENF